MGLRKSFKAYSKKRTKLNLMKYEYSLDLWRANKLRLNMIAKDHADHQVAKRLIILAEEAKSNPKFIIDETIIEVIGSKVYLYKGDKKISSKKIEKKLYGKARKKSSINYKLWIVSKYLT